MEGNSDLPRALRDHLTRQICQHEALFQSSNGRPMTEHDWIQLEEREAAFKGGRKGCRNSKNGGTSMSGKLALLAWKKLRSAGCKRTLYATAHHKRRNSSDAILVAARYRPPEEKSKFELSIARQVSNTRDGGIDHLTQSKKKQRLKEVETEKIKTGMERNRFRRRSAHLVKAAADAAGILVDNDSHQQSENDHHSNLSKTVIKPQSKPATVFGPDAGQSSHRRKLVSGTVTASPDDSIVIKGQQSCCQPPPLQQTCEQEANGGLKNLNQGKSKHFHPLNDAGGNNNFTSKDDDCVKQKDQKTTSTTLGRILQPMEQQHLDHHLPSPDDGAASSESFPLTDCCSSNANNNNLLRSRPDIIIPSLSTSSDDVSNVLLPTSTILHSSAAQHFQSSSYASSISAAPPGSLGEGWGMRVSHALENTLIWKSVGDAVLMTDESRVTENGKRGMGGKREISVPITFTGTTTNLLQKCEKEPQKQRTRLESNNNIRRWDNNNDSSSTVAASNNRDGGDSGRGIRGKCNGENKLPSVSDNFIRMNLRNRKGIFRFKKRKGGGKRKVEGFMKKDENNKSGTVPWSRREGYVDNDHHEDECRSRGCGSDILANRCEQSRWQMERVEVDPGGREDVLDCCIDMLMQQPGHDKGVASDGDAARDKTLHSDRPYDTYTKDQIDTDMDWKKHQLASPPLCSMHRKPARALKVKKSGENHGRYFFVCSKPRGHQCNFFMWAEDAPFFVRKYLMQPCESSEEWLKRRSEILRKDISKKTMAEIKEELVAAKLPHGGGNKAYLIDRLMNRLENLIRDPSLCSSSPSTLMKVTSKGDTPECDGGNDSQDSSSNSIEMWSASSSNDEELELLPVMMNRKEEGMKSGVCVTDHIFLEKPIFILNQLNCTADDEGNEPVVSEEISMQQQPIYSDVVGECQTLISPAALNDSSINKSESFERLGRKKTEDRKEKVLLCNEEAAEDGKMTTQCMSDPSKILKEVFGHSSFRVGQEWAIHRILSGENTLLVLATGSGKSLVYQLPALLLPGITVVVSPLISLMEDQLCHLPPQLPGACMSGRHYSFHRMARTIKELRDGRVKILFLSPERLCSPSFQRLTSLKGVFPEVSLLCVDEAHCVSQWSHNFRPAYMRIASALDGLHPKSILGLTATASPSVISNICSILRISPGDSVKIGSWIRPNLAMNVTHCSGVEAKRVAVCNILADGGALEHGPCIVYVWLQRTAEALAEQLCSHGHRAVAYHGGMSSRDRQKAQKAFMKGRARIIVATVAFGLGVNMKNVRGVVHFDMPTSIEGYVQEIGRAGRDGKEAYCHVLFSDADFRSHHSLAHSNGLELVQIRGLLRMIFRRDKNEVEVTTSTGGAVRHVSVRLKDVCARLDLREEVVETLLSLLEVASRKMVRLCGSILDHCVIEFQKKKPSILAELNTIIAAVCNVGVEVNNGLLGASASGHGYSHGCIQLDVIAVTQALGGEFSPCDVLKELRRLRDEGEIEYSLSERSYHVTLDCRHRQKESWFDEQKLNVLAEALLSQMRDAEASEVRRVEEMYSVLSNSVTKTDDLSNGTMMQGRSGAKEKRKEPSYLHERITQYFKLQQCRQDQQQQQQQGKGKDDEENTVNNSIAIEFPHEEMVKYQSMLQHDAAILMSDPTFRGVGNDGITCPYAWILKDKDVLSRSISRFFHGIGSVAFPVLIWRQNPLWRRYVHLSFEDVLSVITSTVVDLEAKYEGKQQVTD